MGWVIVVLLIVAGVMTWLWMNERNWRQALLNQGATDRSEAGLKCKRLEDRLESERKLREVHQAYEDTWRKIADKSDKKVAELQEERMRRELFLSRMDAAGVKAEGIVNVFGMADDSTAWWQALNLFLAAQSREERSHALVPGLSSEARHFNAGRAAALEDVREQVVQLRERGRAESMKSAEG